MKGNGHNELVEFRPDFLESRIYGICSNLYISDREINDVVSNLNLSFMKKKITIDELEEKVWKIFWVNPYVAIKAVESSVLYETVDLYGALKSVYCAIVNPPGFDLSYMLQNNIMDFTIMIVEICYSDAVQNSQSHYLCEKLLDYAYKARDPKRGTYLNSRNLQHIYYHIPDKRKIMFLNWFCKKYERERQLNRVNKYGKATTDKPLRYIEAIVNEVKSDCLWKYMEDGNAREYSEFASLFMDVKEHHDFLEIVFGKDNFDSKMKKMLGCEQPYPCTTEVG